MPVLFLVVVIDLIGFGVIIPLLPFYAEFYQASPAQVGLVMATYSFTQFLAAPFWGRMSDRTGRKPVLLISLAGAALSYVWLGYCETLWALFAARAVGGFMAGNISTAFACVADMTTRENRAKGMGMIGAAFGLGFIIGPAFGGILAGSDPVNADFQSPALVAAGLSAIAFFLTLTIFKESLSPEIRGAVSQPAPAIPTPRVHSGHNPPGGHILVADFLPCDFCLCRAGGNFCHVVTPPVWLGTGTERVSVCLCRGSRGRLFKAA